MLSLVIQLSQNVLATDVSERVAKPVRPRCQTKREQGREPTISDCLVVGAYFYISHHDLCPWFYIPASAEDKFDLKISKGEVF